MRIAIVGSRGFCAQCDTQFQSASRSPEHRGKTPCAYDHLRRFVISLPSNSVVVSGGAKGADLEGQRVATDAKLLTEIILPDWEKHGRSAGFLRNGTIVEHSDQVVAFWDGKSKGTLDTMRRARQADKQVLLIAPDGKKAFVNEVEDSLDAIYVSAHVPPPQKIQIASRPQKPFRSR
jgi:hypothetical protein